MEGSEGSDPGYDDWFDEPEPPTQEAGRAARGSYDDADEVWVLPGDEERSGPRGARPGIVIGGRTFSTKQAAIIAASVLALLFAGLAAAGVFSGSKSPAASISISSVTLPTTSATSTPPVTTPSAQAPTTTLNPGDTGTEVKTLQRALAALGFSAGKPDGYYGPATQTAVKQFQSSKGLTADGVVGPQTLTALQQALSG